MVRKPDLTSFLLFLLLTLFTLIIFYSSATLIPLYVYELGGNSFHSGLQNSVFFLCAIALRFYFGPLGDARGRKILLVIGVCVFATSPLLFWISKNITHLIGARIYQAVGLAAFFSTGGSLVADLAPPDKLGVYIGANRMMYTLALLTGPWLSQAVVNGWDYGTWFGAAAIFGLIAVVLMLLVRAPRIGLESKQNFSQIMFGTLRDRRLHPIIGNIVVVSIAYGILLTFIPIYLKQEVGMANPGLYFIYFGLAGVLINLISGYLSDRWGRQALVFPVLALMGLGLIMLFWARINPVFVLVSAIFCGISLAAGMVTFAAWMVDLAEPDRRATVMALYDNSIDIAVAGGTFAVGVLNQWLSLPLLFLLVGIMILGYLTAEKFSIKESG